MSRIEFASVFAEHHEAMEAAASGLTRKERQQLMELLKELRKTPQGF